MTALLRTDGVSKAFGGVHALSDCSIEVARGSIAGLIGPNGSGKTTLFNMITGYGQVDSGDVYLNDAKITNLAPDRVFALGIGRTFQLTRVFSRLTVMENMIVAAHYQERSGERGGWLRNPFARAGGAATRRAGDGTAGVHRHRQAGRGPRRDPVLWPAQAARAVVCADRRTGDHPARRAPAG